MPKARELTEIEKFYIENNPDKSTASIASLIDGVGAATVNKYRKSIKETAQEEPPQHSGGSDEERRVHELASGPSAGNFMPSSRGATIMTQQASEVADAKRSVAKKPEKKRTAIHRPKE